VKAEATARLIQKLDELTPLETIPDRFRPSTGMGCFFPVSIMNNHYARDLLSQIACLTAMLSSGNQ